MEGGVPLPQRIACSLFQSASVSNCYKSPEDTADKLRAYPDEMARACWWGRNQHNMFGEKQPDYTAPALVPKFQGITEVACAMNHMLFLKDGEVWGCGLGNLGRLGVPFHFDGVEDRWTEQAYREQIRENEEEELETGPMRLWGPPDYPVVKRVVCGADHSLALCADGTVWAWGCNSEGQCGTGEISEEKMVRLPTKIAAEAAVASGTTMRVTHVAAGGRHSLAVATLSGLVVEEGVVFTWGCNENGRLGLGNASTHASHVRPNRVTSLHSRERITMVAGGESHSGAIDTKRRVWTWGLGSYGRLGIGDVMDKIVPSQVEGALQEAKVAQLALGGFHSVALTADDIPRVFTWGSGEALGLLKEGDNTIVAQPRAVDLKDVQRGDVHVVQIAAGTYHTLLLLNTGEMWSCGLGANGRLGIGSVRNAYRPAHVRRAHAEKDAIPAGYIRRKAPNWVDSSQLDPLSPMATPATGTLKKAAMDVSKGGKGPPSVTIDGGDGQDKATRGRFGTLSEAQEEEEEGADQPEEVPAEREEEVAPRARRVENFRELQDMIKKEPAENKEPALKKEEAELSKKLLAYIQEIETLPTKEAKFVQLQNNIDAVFAKNLQFIKGLPRRSGHSGARTAIAGKEEDYEELAWVLQQQSSYLVSLASCVETKEEQQTFYTVTKALFSELEDPRTLHLFMAMLKSLISREIEQSKRLEDVFAPGEDGQGKKRSSALEFFSFFALHEIHYRDLVHPIMDASIQRKPLTLMGELLKVFNNGEVFALTVEKFKEAAQDDEKKKAYEDDRKELQNDFANSLEGFTKFIEKKCLEIIQKVKLPDNLRKMLAHSVSAVHVRQFNVIEAREAAPQGADESGKALSAADREAEPCVRLFVLGILVPLLKNTHKYAGKEAYLAGGGSVGASDILSLPGMKQNVDTVRSLLEMIGKGPYQNQQGEWRKIKKIYDQAKTVLMKHVMGQMRGVSDDTAVQVVIDFYTAHYELEPHTVVLPGSVLQKLSNILRKHTSKLSINDKDPVAHLCDKVGEQEVEALEAEEHDTVHCFKIASRWLLRERSMTICSISRTPVPPRMSTSSLEEGTRFGNLLEPYEAEDVGYAIFEELLVEVAPLQSKTFKGLFAELEQALEDATKLGAGTQRFGLAQRLLLGLEKLQDLMGMETKEADMFEAVQRTLLARQRHREYLQHVAKGLQRIDRAREHHGKQLQQAEKFLTDVHKFSLKMRPHDVLMQAARLNNKTLRLEDVNNTIERREEFGRTETVRTLSYSPIVTFPLKKLIKSKTVLSTAPWMRHKNADVRISLHLRGGGVEVNIIVHRNGADSIMETMRISEQMIRDLRKQGEGSRFGLPPDDREDEGNPNALIVFSSAKLVELLNEAAAGR